MPRAIPSLKSRVASSSRNDSFIIAQRLRRSRTGRRVKSVISRSALVMCAPTITPHARKAVQLFFSEMIDLCNSTLGVVSHVLLHRFRSTRCITFRVRNARWRGQGVMNATQRRDMCQPLRSCLSLRISLILALSQKDRKESRTPLSPWKRGWGEEPSRSDDSDGEFQAERRPSRMMR